MVELREEPATVALVDDEDAVGGSATVVLVIAGGSGFVAFTALTLDDDDDDGCTLATGLMKMLRISLATSSKEMFSVFNNFSCTLLSGVPAGALER